MLFVDMRKPELCTLPVFAQVQYVQYNSKHCEIRFADMKHDHDPEFGKFVKKFRV